MDKKLCGECRLPINDLEPVHCGFCESYYHISQQCCGFNGRGHKDLFAQGKAIFICATCKVELNGRSIRAYLADKLNCVRAAPMPAAISDQFQQLVETVGSLSDKVDRLMQNRNDQCANVPVWPKLGSNVVAWKIVKLYVIRQTVALVQLISLICQLLPS